MQKVHLHLLEWQLSPNSDIGKLLIFLILSYTTLYSDTSFRQSDASIDPAGFSDDITQLAKRGAGGTELLNYFGLPTVR